MSLDLSIGGVIVAVSHILTSGALPYFEPVLIAICILFGLTVGATNALFIRRLRGLSVTVTLAVAMILTGVVIWLGQFYAPGDAPDVLKFIGQKRIGIFPIALFVWRAVLIHAALIFALSGLRPLCRCDWYQPKCDVGVGSMDIVVILR